MSVTLKKPTDWSVPVPMTFTRGELANLLSAAKRMAKNRENYDSKKGYVPPPGKQNAGLAQAAALRAIASKIESVLETLP